MRVCVCVRAACALVLCLETYHEVDYTGHLAEAVLLVVAEEVCHQEVKDAHSDGRRKTTQLELCGRGKAV